MIPVCTPLLGKLEERYVLDCLRTNWISSSGKYLKMFEDQFSRYCGHTYGITVSNGTTALHLALAALDLKKDDEVIMPTFTIASTAFAAMYLGAKPVFVDIEADTWNIDPGRIEEKITKKTKVIMPVHIYGHPCDMDPIMALAKRYKLTVVEDAAETHGAEYHGKRIGGYGQLACFSFYGNKIITCGEGGMVLTSDEHLAARCRQLKNLSFIESKRFWHEDIGYNYRMTNIQAAIGVAQLERIDELMSNRIRNARLYNNLLSPIPGLTLPVQRKDVKNVYWMYGLLVEKEFGMGREELMNRLAEKGIETRTFFYPIHNQPFLKKHGIVSKGRFPVADAVSQKGFYLPSGSGLKRTEIEYICDSIKKIQRGK